ncbi:TetR/AcrR family transcriptional regulator [Tellurirhabdus bombi]|uniref:TetR/AcrR family transcriptional regulator n=1 Tax=Tellurirhabdus bombi TaxID=2907205 RepID=UPI001F24563F|nr:TetR/AcrR family transcriptional regulator [Tellurirhabdus bombi]
MKKIAKRNRQMTMQRILAALGDVIAEQGADKAGINAVADKAGINKVLIYRYFGGYEGLMQSFTEQSDFWTIFNDQFLENNRERMTTSSQNQVWSDYMVQFARAFRHRRVAQELLKWEIANSGSALSAHMTQTRQEALQKLVNQLSPDTRHDTKAVAAILLAAITQLSFLASANYKLFDIDLQSDEGWQRIERAIRQIYTCVDQA